MLVRTLSAIVFTLLPWTADAQVGSIFGNRPPRPPSYQTHIPAPSDSSERHTAVDPNEVVAKLVDWVHATVLSRTEFKAAFGTCRQIVSEYQELVLVQLDARIQAARSRTAQQELDAKARALRSRRDVDTKIACLKKLFADLRLADTSGHVGDQLSVLDGSLESTRDDLPHKAKVIFEDLTAAGLNELAEKWSLSNMDRRDLLAVVDIGIVSYPNPGSVLACLLPLRWVDWFASYRQCHGARLESSLFNAASRL